MTIRAFDKIAAGLEDAIAYVQGDASRARLAEPVDVRAVRSLAKKTQVEFADAYRIPVATLRDWEQGRRQPDAPARALLAVIAADPAAVERMLAAH
jgi:putative transcriptional regulator